MNNETPMHTFLRDQCTDKTAFIGVNDVGACRYIGCDSNNPCPTGTCTTETSTRGATISFCQ